MKLKRLLFVLPFMLCSCFNLDFIKSKNNTNETSGNIEYDSIDNLNFTLHDDGHYSVKVKEEKKYAIHNIKIPSEYNGKKVTEIEELGFSRCILLSVVLPNTVNSIGDYAFCNCSYLNSINIPNFVISIGNGTFDHCSSLTSIVIPDSVTHIGSGAFAYCSSLISINIPKSVTFIDYCAFMYCSSLTSIVIPDSVTFIGGGAFEGCSSLTIYCEASYRPSTWSNSWSLFCPVVWGYHYNR